MGKNQNKGGKETQNGFFLDGGGGGVLTPRLDELQSIENQELPSTLKCV